MSIPTNDAERFGVCLVGLQTGNIHACEQFDELLRPYLLNLTRKLASDLPDDLHEEVVQQAYLDLIGNSSIRFDPQRGSAKSFLYFAVRNALRIVRSNYCPPGAPTRSDTSSKDRSVSALSIDDLDHEPGTLNVARQIIAGTEANALLKTAPRRVATALRRIHYIGDSLNEVASDLNVSRFKLSREIDTYCKTMRFADSQIVTAYRFVC
jgi:DNA-directed RNA polymerase specialized sigma subunit